MEQTGRQYMNDCLVTDVRDYNPMLDRLNVLDPRLIHAIMGIVTESGEITDALKKHLIYGKELDRTNLVEEAGDIMWYISLLLVHLDVSYEEVWEKNIAKLRIRYPDKFNAEKALNRNLAAERAVLSSSE